MTVFTFYVFSQIEVTGSVKLPVIALCKQRCASYIMQKNISLSNVLIFRNVII